MERWISHGFVPPYYSVTPRLLMAARCRIELFGGLRALQGDRAVTRFRTQKTGSLLAYLAFYPRKIHYREILIEILWPDTAPESGRNSLSVALSSLRQLLEPAGVDASSVLRADRFTVQFEPSAIVTDGAAYGRYSIGRRAREQRGMASCRPAPRGRIWRPDPLLGDDRGAGKAGTGSRESG
jgi:hypothetical protein